MLTRLSLTGIACRKCARRPRHSLEPTGAFGVFVYGVCLAVAFHLFVIFVENRHSDGGLMHRMSVTAVRSDAGFQDDAMCRPSSRRYSERALPPMYKAPTQILAGPTE